jgi:hypothetical protein
VPDAEVHPEFPSDELVHLEHDGVHFAGIQPSFSSSNGKFEGKGVPESGGGSLSA